MDRKLIDYLPPALQRVTEFMAITEAQQPEIEKAWDALDFVMNNQFIDTATEAGVSVWESELGITPSNTDTLEDRKQRIKLFWTYGVVYTYNWLVDWLKTFCGNGNLLPAINEYTLRVSLPITIDYLSVLENLRKYISANVLIDPLLLLSKINMPLYTGAAFRSSSVQKLQTDDWNTDDIVLLADEDGNVLMEEADSIIFFEEVTV